MGITIAARAIRTLAAIVAGARCWLSPRRRVIAARRETTGCSIGARRRVIDRRSRVVRLGRRIVLLGRGVVLLRWRIVLLGRSVVRGGRRVLLRRGRVLLRRGVGRRLIGGGDCGGGDEQRQCRKP